MQETANQMNNDHFFIQKNKKISLVSEIKKKVDQEQKPEGKFSKFKSLLKGHS